MRKTFIIMATLLVAMFGMAFDTSALTSYLNVRLAASVNVAQETNNKEKLYGYVSTTQEGTPDASKFKLLGTEDVIFTLTWSGSKVYREKNIYVYFKYEKSGQGEYKITKIEQYKKITKLFDAVVEKEKDHSVTQSAVQCIQFSAAPTTIEVCNWESPGYYHRFNAVLIPRGVVSVNYDDSNISDSKPTVSYSPEYNYIDENVTLKASMPQYKDGNGNTCDNPHYSFEGWYDGNTLVSGLPEFSMTAQKKHQNLTARYSFKPSFIGKGYYRIRTARNGSPEYVKVVGNVGGNSTIAGQRFTTANLVLTGDGVSDYPYSESDPATIFYFDGTMNTALASDAKNLSFGKQLSTDAVLSSQGASTATMFDAFGGKIEIASGYYAGSIALRPAGSDKWLVRVGDADKAYGGLAINGNLNDPNATFELEPVNDENINSFYMGVTPDAETLYENGYWTTMYTSFPYICTTGVEPYYLKVTDAQCNYELTPITTRMTDNRTVVPANTAVLLKCDNTAANLNKLIPVAPDAAVEPIADNYLAGVFQLNKSIRSGNSDVETARLYNFNNNRRNGDYMQIDPLKYVFRCITEADLQKAVKVRARTQANEGTYCPLAFDRPVAEDVLGPNNVYLNAQKIVDVYNVAPEDLPKAFSVNPVAIPTGVEGINANEETPEYYNLQGVRVNNPAAGEIYIVRVGERIFKAVYSGR